MNSIKCSGYRIGIKFNKDFLVVGENSYLTKIVNVHIVCDLDAWSRNSTNNFKFKNCLFGATSIVKNSDKEKYVSKEYKFWSFHNGTARNLIIFGVDNSLACYYDNRIKIF